MAKRSPKTGDELLLHNAYEAAKRACKSQYCSDATASAIDTLVGISLKFLKEKCKSIDLDSKVPSKSYFSFQSKDGRSQLSRPINLAHFNHDLDQVSKQWTAWRGGKALSHESLRKMIYTVAISPCAAMEVFDKGNKKGPATYFECLIGHVFSEAFGVEPRKKASLPVKGKRVRLTMDLIFDLGDGKPSIHMPVKMSTRERIVQAWAHQRLLDAAFGAKKYKGIMVLFSETKLDSRTHEVVEICVPDQWLAYQALLSKMTRIYYFDIPAKYKALTDSFPDLITIKNFGDFFAEKASVMAGD
jgi:hypothetical protein